MSELEDDLRAKLAEASLAVEEAIDALGAYRRVLNAAGRRPVPATADALGKFVQGAGLLASTVADDLTRLYADDGLSGDDLLNQAENVVLELDPAEPGTVAPSGSTPSPADDERVQAAAAVMLARLWSAGRLLGPVPYQAWPSADLARLLLPTLQQHVNSLSIEDELDRLRGDTHRR
ncbi:hypothetical protein AB0C84_42580 [Actinomadura sp. NPDC048955]|uniref:hypothetical protein n=1 Tax=Actinomadura sp. NPDC048955 TaxID=3158228 RepID=UPI0033DAD6AB